MRETPSPCRPTFHKLRTVRACSLSSLEEMEEPPLGQCMPSAPRRCSERATHSPGRFSPSFVRGFEHAWDGIAQLWPWMKGTRGEGPRWPAWFFLSSFLPVFLPRGPAGEREREKGGGSKGQEGKFSSYPTKEKRGKTGLSPLSCLPRRPLKVVE